MLRNHYHYDHLRNTPLFEDLDRAELEMLGRAVTELDLPPGRQLIAEGSRGRDMFVVVSGTLEVTRDGVHVAEIGPGEFVGEMALLTGDERNATVTVATQARVLHVDGRGLSTVLDAPQIAAKMLHVVARRAADNSALAHA